MQVGTPLDLYMNPANAFVAGFIGSPKLSFLDIAGGTFLDKAVPLDAGIGGPGRRLTLSDAETNGLAFVARVVRIEDLGHEVLIRAQNSRNRRDRDGPHIRHGSCNRAAG